MPDNETSGARTDDGLEGAKECNRVIAIDGPAGVGKSSVSRKLAKRLGFDFLDTGAMYRSVTLAAIRSGLRLDDQEAIAALARSLDIQIEGTDTGTRVLLDGQDVSAAIRTPEVTEAIGSIASNVEVRKLLSQRQRDWARGRCVVTEGRDQGSEVFKDAACKIFLTASGLERAKRRQADLKRQGIMMDLETVLEQQSRRDADDAARDVGGLHKADDAIEFNTDGLTLDEVVDRLEALVRAHCTEQMPASGKMSLANRQARDVGEEAQ